MNKKYGLENTIKSHVESCVLCNWKIMHFGSITEISGVSEQVMIVLDTLQFTKTMLLCHESLVAKGVCF